VRRQGPRLDPLFAPRTVAIVGASADSAKWGHILAQRALLLTEGEAMLRLILNSREGNVGVKGVPPFAPDCQDSAKKKLNKLDPKPPDE